MGALLNLARAQHPDVSQPRAPIITELAALIRVVLSDAPHEHEEALAVAVKDPEAALTSYRLLAAGIVGRQQPADNEAGRT